MSTEDKKENYKKRQQDEQDPLQKYSKLLSFILRHHPEKFNLTLDKQGWVDIKSLLASVSQSYADFDQSLLLEIVRTDSKTRYAISADGLNIRANQGHNKNVAVQLDFVQQEPPEFLFHGTEERIVPTILSQGLVSQSRQYVHLSETYKTAWDVGARRKNKVCVLSIKAKQMHNAGYKFFLSDNNVWLVNLVPPEFVQKPE